MTSIRQAASRAYAAAYLLLLLLALRLLLVCVVALRDLETRLRGETA